MQFRMAMRVHALLTATAIALFLLVTGEAVRLNVHTQRDRASTSVSAAARRLGATGYDAPANTLSLTDSTYSSHIGHQKAVLVFFYLK